MARKRAKKNKPRKVSIAMALAASHSFNTALAGTTTCLVNSTIVDRIPISGTSIEVAGYKSPNVTVDLYGGSGAILNWSSLGVGPNQRLQFNFSNTSSTAAVLNRVTGGDLSQISGIIASDGGKVFLSNPAGITFTGGATINVPLFVATTLSVSDDAFINYAIGAGSSLPLRNGTGTIQVTGSVTTEGSVALIAPTVLVAPGVSFTNVVQADTADAASDGSVSVPTLAPTTLAPTTLAPTTIAPTTIAPTTIPPTPVPTPAPTSAPTSAPTAAPTSAPVTNPVVEAQQSTTSTLVAMFTSQLGGTTGGTTGVSGQSSAAPQTVEATDSGAALFSVISPGSTPGGAGTPGSGTGGSGAAGAGPGTGPGQPGGSGAGGTPPADSSDRALTVVANPPPVQGASQPVPRPPQTTTQLGQGLSQMVTGGLGPPSGGVPGIRGDFSSSGNPGRW